MLSPTATELCLRVLRATPLTEKQSQVRDTVDEPKVDHCDAGLKKQLEEKKTSWVEAVCVLSSSTLRDILTYVKAVDSWKTLSGIGAGGSPKQIQLSSHNTTRGGEK